VLKNEENNINIRL